MKISKLSGFGVLLLILSLTLGYFVLPSNAAQVTHFSDQVGNNGISAAANHIIKFTTPSGVAAGQTMILGFDGGFNLSAVDYTDIDLADDGVDLSLAATPSGAVWGAVFSGNDLTITSGAGAIAGGSIVTIEIGTHASFEFSGDQQIINPNTYGAYVVNLSGTFGDTGQLWVAVFDDTVGITASVPSHGGGEGDSSPPIISNVQVINITTNSATVTWLTNEPATSTVQYGLYIGYELGDETIIEYVTFHSIDLADLLPDTVYHFIVISYDSDGNMALSDDYTFRTLKEELPTECVINCESVVYDLYIVNPDLTERHMFTDYTRIEMLSADVWRIAFEDSGEDFDYNDIVADVDKSDCEDIKIKIVSFNASWHHQIKIKISNGAQSEDILLWPDSHTAGEIYVNAFDYPTLCGLTELAKVRLRVLPEKRLPPTGNNGTLLWVRMMNAGNPRIVFNTQVWTDADGYSAGLPLNNLPAGNYDFLLKGYSHLDYRKNNINLNSATTLIDFSEGAKIYVKAGDVNGTVGDNYVNGMDLSLLSQYIYTDDYRNDLNQDKLVNGIEFAIAVTNLYKWGDF
jgi:hypothetical protein